MSPFSPGAHATPYPLSSAGAQGYPGYATATAPPVVPIAPHRPRWWLIVGSAVLAIALVIVIMKVVRSSDSSASPRAATADPPPTARTTSGPAATPTTSGTTAPPPSSAPGSAAAATSERPAPAAAPSDPPSAAPSASSPSAAPDADPDEEPAEPSDPGDASVAGELPVVGSGPCRLNVTVTPAGSQVKADGRLLGVAPLAIDGPCTRRKLEISHPRYAPATRFATPVRDKPQDVEITLARPTHALTVVTIPAGATISIQGRRAGTSPTVVQLMGFYGVTLTFEKKGYKTATQRVYSKVPQDRITVRLAPGR